MQSEHSYLNIQVFSRLSISTPFFFIVWIITAQTFSLIDIYLHSVVFKCMFCCFCSSWGQEGTSSFYIDLISRANRAEFNKPACFRSDIDFSPAEQRPSYGDDKTLNRVYSKWSLARTCFLYITDAVLIRVQIITFCCIITHQVQHPGPPANSPLPSGKQCR